MHGSQYRTVVGGCLGVWLYCNIAGSYTFECYDGRKFVSGRGRNGCGYDNGLCFGLG